jgi:hypothetical protein
VIKPTIGELLTGVATSLRERVLPEIPAGTTRRQIQAAIGIIRRVALVWDKTGPYIGTDNQDIVQTLEQMLPVLARVAAEEGSERLRLIHAKSREILERANRFVDQSLSAEVLGVRNLELQEALAEMQEALHDSPAVESVDRNNLKSMLFALFRRMLMREMEITTPARRP